MKEIDLGLFYFIRFWCLIHCMEELACITLRIMAIRIACKQFFQLHIQHQLQNLGKFLIDIQ